MPPWAPRRDAFTALARHAVELLNPVLRRYVEGAEVYVSDVPGMELVAEGVDPRALVLLDGLSAEDPARIIHSVSDFVPCGRVFVYALNVARLAGNADGVEREIMLALEREITVTFLEAEQSERTQRELN